jgi:hypothetical protein
MGAPALWSELDGFLGEFLVSLHDLLQVVMLAFSKLACERLILEEPLTDLVNVVCSFRSLEHLSW